MKPHEHLPRDVDDADLYTFTLDHRGSAARDTLGKVGGADDACVAFGESFDLFFPVKKMIPTRQDITTVLKKFFGDTFREPRASRGVLGVAHDEVYQTLLLHGDNNFLNRLTPRIAVGIAYKQYL